MFDWIVTLMGHGGYLGIFLRTLISIPAGVARMPLGRFLMLTALGSAVWTGLLGIAGYLLEGQYARVEAWVNPASTLVVALLALWYIVRLVQFRRA